MDKDEAQKIIELLAEQLGVEASDIKNEDLLVDDLHMTPADFTDFFETLETEGFDTSKLDPSEIQSVEELVESFTA